jgi:predicted ATPase/DNA-binding SARP family transcriptional activator
MLRLLLFGPPRLEHNGQIIPLRRTKALALLAYIALTGQPQDRETLLALLWPEFDPASARNNLRRELSLLKTTLGAEILSADRLQVCWNGQAEHWLDVADFHAQLALVKQHGHAADTLCAACAAALTTAVQHYTDDFMAGFSLPDSPAFDEWQFFQREQLRHQLATALQALISWQGASGAYGVALAYARRWLQLDGLHEPAQREVMRLYAYAGQPAAALRQYQECVRLLDAELGAEPEPATTALYEAIKARRVAAPPTSALPTAAADAVADTRAVEPLAPLPTLALQTLPPPAAGFVGRQRELADIIRRLTDPACRLLTLTGPGGIGKTQLAIRAAQTLAEGWAGDAALADGVLFVPLTAVTTTGGLVAALAAAAHFDFYANVPPHQQVLDYFREKRMLIVLDNFEQLLDTAGFVSELLAAAPHLRLLITSRAALNLREEWFHPLEGLSFPAKGEDIATVAQLARYDAVRLFDQHGRRARSDFVLSRERAEVVRLCQLVEGLPLAIELAAAWLKVLTVEQVAAAIERGLDILTVRDKQIPDRHRSMRAVLDESWRLLSAEEQQTLAGLSVFSGGFSAEAAMAVVGASLDVLATLVEKSLLRTAADGRFQLHELLRQFAAEQLGSGEQLAETTGARHGAYYLAFLEQREQRLLGLDRRAAATEMAREAANLRAAWRWAIQRGDSVRIGQVLASYFSYYYARNDYQEGAEVFNQALSINPSESIPDCARTHRGVLARIRIRYGAFLCYLGDYSAAVRELDHGLAEASEIGIQHDVAFAHMMLGVVARWQGDAAVARQHLGDALAIGTANGDQMLVAEVLRELAGAAVSCGEYAESERLARESLAIHRVAARDDLIVHTLARLAWSVSCRGDYAAAEAYYRESLALAERIGDDIGIAGASGGLGWIAWCIGGARFEEARGYIERSLVINRRRGLRLWISNHIGDLALIAIDCGEYALAEAYAQEGLAISRALDSAIYTTYHLGILGRVAAARQEFAASRRYLHEALRTASQAQLWSQLALSLYHTAVALHCEAAFVGANHPAYAARQAHALELLASISHHPTVWHVCQMRAQHLSDELRRGLPPELAAAAIARGQQFDWQVSITALLDELARPALLTLPGAVDDLPQLSASVAA